MGFNTIYTAVLGAEGVAASTAYVLVDLSDTTNFPHAGTTELHLKWLSLNTEKATDGAYDIFVGVITEVDATNGTADWIHVFHLEHVNNSTDSTDRYSAVIDFTGGGGMEQGINCNITGGALTYVVTNQQQAGHTNWQTDVDLASPVGTTTNPGPGDLVVWVEEVAGSGTIDFSITAQYAAL